jgi:acyl-CoA synthetase (AMP-forming)/AMP-acid ligase II
MSQPDRGTPQQAVKEQNMLDSNTIDTASVMGEHRPEFDSPKKSLIDTVWNYVQGRNPVWLFPAEGRKLMLSDIWNDTGRLSAILSKQRVRAGDHVVLILDNSSDYLSLLLAIWRIGAVAVPIRPYGGKHVWIDTYLEHIHQICGFRLAIHDDPNLAKFQHIAAHLGKPFLSLQTMRRDMPVLNDLAYAADPSELAIVQFTSGSTGQPKGVMVTHGMVMEQVRQLCHSFAMIAQYPGPRVAASWLPFYHDMGLFIGLLTPLYAGSDAIAASPSYYMRNPARWFRLMSQYHCDLSFTTNSVLASSLRSLGRLQPSDCDLSALKLWIAAEKVSPRVVDMATKTLVPLGLKPEMLKIGYGMAENALGATSSPPGLVRRLHIQINGNQVLLAEPGARDVIELVSVGIAHDNCVFTVRAADDSILPDLILGEINITGGSVSPGYLNDRENTAAKLAGGRLRTGDIGFLYNNELYFVARQDEMLIVSGRNIIPSDVELAVEELPSIGHGRTVLFAVDCSETGVSRSVLLVESNGEAVPSVQEDLRGAIRERVLDQFGFVLGSVMFVAKGTIEKTSSGKKRTNIVRQRYLAQEIEIVGSTYAR